MYECFHCGMKSVVWDCDYDFIEPYCSVCGTGLDVIYHYKFCPECGADMRGESNDDK